ncbi:MAG: hypothetical protein LWY06_01265 [Firmicutes bacterium]|nr:hypothetical protein [Bacillota bacterium]
MSNQNKYETCPRQDENEKWIPKVKVFVTKEGKTETITLEAPEFIYDEEKEAARHGVYMAKEYLASL